MILSYPERTLLLVGGVPGAGKSHLLRNSIPQPGVEILSADAVRGRVQQERGFAFHDFREDCIPEARERFFTSLDALLLDGHSVVTEAAYLTERSRLEMVQHAAEENYQCHLLIVKAALWECYTGVAQRARKVDEIALARYYGDFLCLQSDLLNGRTPGGIQSTVVVERSTRIDGIMFGD